MVAVFQVIESVSQTSKSSVRGGRKIVAVAQVDRDKKNAQEKGNPCSSPGFLIGPLLAIDHPRHAKLIHQHAETESPEGLGNRHGDFRFFRQSIEQTLRFLGRVDSDINAEAGLTLEATGRRVRRHDDIIAQRHSAMKDLSVHFLRCLFRHGRFAVAHHHNGFGAERLFIELEGLFAIAVEMEVGVEFHISSADL
jgi:hypothetical protein